MRLKSEDAGLFYELFLPLLDYVNENYHVIGAYSKSLYFQAESKSGSENDKMAYF